MPGGPESETLVSIFLSGRRSQHSADGAKWDPSTGTGRPEDYESKYKEVEYFPDPPCIAPFQDEEERQVVAKKMLGTNPQEYWKSHATWHEDDPSLVAPRARGDAFIKLYNAKLGRGSDNTKLSRSVKAIRRNYTGTGSSADLQVVDAFVNISGNSVGIRKTGSLSDAERTGEVVCSGECVVVDRIVEDGHIRFLSLADGRGWVFDRNQEGQVMARMDELETCRSWYRVICKEMVAIRSAPVYDEAVKSGCILSSKELAVVNIKCRIHGHMFVHLADGRGWVFLMKPMSDKKKRTYADTVMEECDGEILQDERWLDQNEILPATNDVVEVGLWTYVVGEEPVLAVGARLHGTYLNSGDVLKVDKRALAHGDAALPGEEPRRWLRLMDGRGWLAERGTTGKPVVLLQGSAVSYPATFRKKEKVTDTPRAAWMVGVA